MKLSEADFRPKRRSGVVPSPPRRKIPLFRLLILVVAAALVYRHFDAYWPKLRAMFKSSSTGPVAKYGYPASDDGLRWSFSPDSTQAVLNKGSAREQDFCGSLESMTPGLCDEVRAVMHKGRWMEALNAPVASKVEVHLSRTESGSTGVPVLTALEGDDGDKNFRYQRIGDKGSWCNSNGDCLSSRPPRMPLAQGISSDPALGEPISRWTSSQPGVFPVLPGKVVSVDSLGSENHRVILYHGRELYTTYEGLRHLATGLAAGVAVNPDVSIAEAGVGDSLSSSESSRYALGFRVEQAGMPLDPADFFAAQAGLKP